MNLKKKLEKVLLSIGIFSSLFGMQAINATNKPVENTIVLTQDMGKHIANERFVVNNDVNNTAMNETYDYSQSSRASHLSHLSHLSHYSHYSHFSSKR